MHFNKRNMLISEDEFGVFAVVFYRILPQTTPPATASALHLNLATHHATPLPPNIPTLFQLGPLLALLVSKPDGPSV